MQNIFEMIMYFCFKNIHYSVLYKTFYSTKTKCSVSIVEYTILDETETEMKRNFGECQATDESYADTAFMKKMSIKFC